MSSRICHRRHIVAWPTSWPEPRNLTALSSLRHKLDGSSMSAADIASILIRFPFRWHQTAKSFVYYEKAVSRYVLGEFLFAAMKALRFCPARPLPERGRRSILKKGKDRTVTPLCLASFSSRNGAMGRVLNYLTSWLTDLSVSKQ